MGKRRAVLATVVDTAEPVESEGEEPTVAAPKDVPGAPKPLPFSLGSTIRPIERYCLKDPGYKAYRCPVGSNAYAPIPWHIEPIFAVPERAVTSLHRFGAIRKFELPDPTKNRDDSQIVAPKIRALAVFGAPFVPTNQSIAHNQEVSFAYDPPVLLERAHRYLHDLSGIATSLKVLYS